jgi:hypothetical protein
MTALPDMLHILQHSLGVDRFGRGEYRNHFVTGEGSLDHPACMDAVSRGLMQRHPGNALTGEMDLFVVTEAGKQFVRDNVQKVDAKQRRKDRYSRFLDLSDVMPDLTFRDFLKRKELHK